MKTSKNTKSGIVAALIKLGFRQDAGPFPPSLKNVASGATFTADEMSFAEYMVADDDFGGCWNDETQINMQCAA